ncbi:MAG: outer membrane beta-barrel protein [Elusimicrobiota bacterium]
MDNRLIKIIAAQLMVIFFSVCVAGSTVYEGNINVGYYNWSDSHSSSIKAESGNLWGFRVGSYINDNIRTGINYNTWQLNFGSYDDEGAVVSSGSSLWNAFYVSSDLILLQTNRYAPYIGLGAGFYKRSYTYKSANVEKNENQHWRFGHNYTIGVQLNLSENYIINFGIRYHDIPATFNYNRRALYNILAGVSYIKF